MRTPFRLFPLISLIALVALLAPAVPARGMPESGAVIVVNTLVDELDIDGNCSLREAVLAANTNHAVDACIAGTGFDRIVLPAGILQLSIAGPDEDGAQTGDLDILENLYIEGAGQGLTVIDGGGISPEIHIDRVFHIHEAVSVEISHVVIQNGYAETGILGGGGILNQSGILTLSYVSMQSNYSGGVGGGLDNTGVVTFIKSSVSNNEAGNGGGIFNSISGTLFLYSSTLNGNTATMESGGGLANRGSGTLENVTISGNSAVKGGGIWNDGTLHLLNSSLLYNASTDTSKGGNIHSFYEIRFINTLVAYSQSGANCVGVGYVSLGYNLDSENTCGFNQSTDLYGIGDPLLGPLQDNGGPTLTHALLEGSPAIDTGTDLDCPETDQRSAFRPADGNGDHIKACDIGAFEYAGIFPTYLFLASVMR